MPPCHKLLRPLLLPLLILPLALHSNSKVRAQSRDDLIRLTVTVWNGRGFVNGLTREAFQISDEKVARQVEFFETDDAPASIGILIDTSESMKVDLGEKILNRFGKEMLSSFIQRSNIGNEYFLLSFDETIRSSEWGGGQELLSRMPETTRVKKKGYTAFYDACFAGIEKLQTSHTSRRVLILLSDGLDNSSRHTFNEVRNLLRGADIILYVIGIISVSDLGSSLGMEGQGVLKEFAQLTGGRVFFPRNKNEIVDAFFLINDELHSQYRLGFRPGQMDKPNQWRRIKLKIAPPANAPREYKNLSFRTRRGYYTK